MEMIAQFIDVILHLNDHLNDWAAWMGPWLYAILFLIIFAETGLVVTPFLPGDSLLFAVGALCASQGSVLNIWTMMVLLIIAAILGDAVNYSIGARVGPRVFHSETSRLLNKKHLLKTQRFYEKYGGKTIIIARFVPIVRTFAPFVAGIGRMGYQRFLSFNVIGALAWVIGFLAAGYMFGNLKVVKDRFHIVIVAIIILSVMPAVIEIIKEKRNAARESAERPDPA
jgi:membrane-associated protein